MNKVILYPNRDGTTSICFPAPRGRGFVTEGETTRPETDEEWLSRILAKDVPQDVPALVIDRTELPPHEQWDKIRLVNGRLTLTD